jgi:phosphomannomutase
VATIAEKNSQRFVATPTGFKWISRPHDLLAGFEEALGYLVNPDTVRDKDGISAGLALLALAHRLHQKKMTLSNRLSEIIEQYGSWASETMSIRLGSVSEVSLLMAAIRRSPGALVGTDADVSITDYLDNSPPDFPASDLIVAQDGKGCRAIIRPSGTEPKLKIYLDVVTGSGAESDSAVRRMTDQYHSRLTALIADGGHA